MLPSNQSHWPEPNGTPRPGGPGRRRALTTVLVAVVVIGAVFSVGISWLASRTDHPTRPSVAVDPSPTVAGTLGGAGAAAIQELIQRADDEQVQAIAAREPSPMAETSTDDYYQKLVQSNQQLLATGVSTIKLVQIEWGVVAINGATANATAWETWSTSYSNGTTELARRGNLYTLVQTDGTWKIQSDEDPASPGSDIRVSGAPSGPSTPDQPGPPAAPGSQAASQNWSGYAATDGAFTGVSATWNIPAFVAEAIAGVDATWVGIGGVRSHDLIQAGTDETVSGNGATRYQAWVEALPQASQPVPLAIHPGDSVSVSITQQDDPNWLIAFTNNTTGETYHVVGQYASSMSSAEWVEEAPSARRGRVLPLGDFGTITFSQASTVKGGRQATIADAGGRAITMVGVNGQPVVAPSALGADGASFSISQTGSP